MAEPQEDGIFKIEVNHPKKGAITVEAYRYNGQEYLNTEHSELYIGKSKYWLLRKIRELEAENPEEPFRFKFEDAPDFVPKGSILIQRTLLDEFIRSDKGKSKPKPEPKPTLRPYRSGTRKSKHSEVSN